jgi:hypothetical protein
VNQPRNHYIPVGHGRYIDPRDYPENHTPAVIRAKREARKGSRHAIQSMSRIEMLIIAVLTSVLTTLLFTQHCG